MALATPTPNSPYLSDQQPDDTTRLERSVWPGLVLATVIAGAAFAARSLPGLGILSPLLLAITIGVVFQNVVGMPEKARLEMLEKTAAGLPVGRVGLGDDIAHQILAFMTIGFATGSIVYIDGGALIA